VTEKERMLAGERYKDSDPELVAERRGCQSLVDRFNATTSTQEAERRAILGELFGGLGEGSWVMPRFQCDYGYLITIGDDAVIGAGAVVTRDVPAKVFAAGNPCRVIKEL